jgi:hypothetical protein
MQTADMCTHDDLSTFRDSPVPISVAAVSISFADAVRLDDISVSLISPRGRNFFLMRNSCFGCFKNCGQTRDSLFSFQCPPALGLDSVPKSLCPNYGDYSALDDLDLREELTLGTSMGRWFVRVSSGSQPLNVSRVYMKFETSSMQVHIGVSAVSGLTWTADSSVTLIAPGYQLSPHPSAAGWGRNMTVSASPLSYESALFSYPDPEIGNALNRDLGLGTGSNLISLTGRYFANVYSSLRSRLFSTVCVHTSWTSDTSVHCHTPEVATHARAFYVSVESSAVAAYSLNLSLAAFRLLPITTTNASSLTMPMTGLHHASFVGSAFGMWDSSFHVRVKRGKSAASVTKWLHDSAIALSYKSNPENVDSRTLLLSVDSSLRSFDVQTRSAAAVLVGSVRSFLSTGSQITALTGVQLGVYSSSSAIKVLQTAAQYSHWFSDSSARCKSSSGVASASGGIVISMDSTAIISPSRFSFSSPVILNISVASAANVTATSLHFLSVDSGTAGQSFNLSVMGTRCTETLWISDSHIQCMNAWALSKDYFELETVAEFYSSHEHEHVFTGYVANPDFIAAPSPIASSFVPAAFVSISKETLSSITTYARFGRNYGPPDFLNQPQVPSIIQYSEIVDVDSVFVCNYTQVYLKNYEPVKVDVLVTFSLTNRDDGSSLDHLICSGSTSVIASLAARSYASVARTSMTFCSNVSLPSAVLRSRVAVKNETGSWINFVTDTPPFFIVAANLASLSLLNSTSSVAEVVVRRMFFPAAVFRLNTSASCDRVQFYFQARLACVLSSDGEFNVSVPFFARGDSSSAVFVMQEVVTRSCVFNISAVIPIHPGLCFLAVTVPAFPGLFSRSFNISVINDDPFTFGIVGRIGAKLEEGEVIWSANASGSACLRVTLYDKHNNMVKQCQRDFELTASLLNASQISKYTLYGSTGGVSDCQGGISWCHTRVTYSGIIQLNISSPYFNQIIASSINVTGQGAPSQIAVVTPHAQIASTVQAGNTMSSIQIQVTNAVGIALKQIDGVVVKIRVIPKNVSAVRYET